MPEMETLKVAIGVYTKNNVALSEEDIDSLGQYLSKVTGRPVELVDVDQITDLTWQWSADEADDLKVNAARIVDIAQDYWVIATDCFTAPMTNTMHQLTPLLAARCENFAGVVGKILDDEGNFIRWGHLM